jgi:DNA-binding transcriptional MerR regulator
MGSGRTASMGLAVITARQGKNMDAQRRSDEEHKTYSIGDLAREFGVSLRTLRFYEDRGLLTPHRKGTVRLYDEQHKTRLSMILKAKQLGFILSEIRVLIARWKQDTAHLELPLTPEEIDRQVLHLEAQKRTIECAIQELTSRREAKPHDD